MRRLYHPNSTLTANGCQVATDCFSMIAEHSSDAILIRDEQKRISSWNKGAEKLLGYTKEEAFGKTAMELGIIRLSAKEFQELNETLQKTGTWVAEKNYYHKNGSSFTGEVKAHALYDKNGEMNSAVFIIRDITHQKELEAQLRKTQSELEEKVQEKTIALVRRERRFRAMTEYNNDITLLLNEEYKLIYASPSAGRHTGWTENEVNNLEHLSQLVHPDDREQAEFNVYASFKQPGKPINTSFRFRNTNGEYLHFELTITNLLKEPNIEAVIINARNITERKNREAELNTHRNTLLEKEKLLELYTHNSPAAIAMFDKNMCYLAVTDLWLSAFQLQGQELKGRCHYDVFPGIPEEWKEVHRRCLKGEVIRNEEDHFTLQDGGCLWIRWEVHPWFDADGEVGGLLIFSEDITKRKVAEEAVRKSEERHRSLVERISDGFIALDENYNFTYVNPVAALMLGKKADYLTGKYLWAEYPEAVGKTFHRAYRKALRTQRPVHLEAMSIALGKWLVADIYPSPTGLSIFFRDKTEQKAAEEQARKSDEIRMQIMQSAMDAIICTDRQGRITLWNTNAAGLFGWESEEMMGRDISDTIIPERYRSLHREGLRRFLENGVGPVLNKLIELSAVNKQGEEFPVELFIASIGQGEDLFFCSFIRDITKRKKAETEILLSQRRLQLAQEIARLGHWEIDLVNDRSHWSDEAYRIYGIEPGDHMITEAEWLGFVHPEDRHTVMQLVNKSRASLDKSAFYHRILLKDGTIRNVYTESRYEFDRQGKPILHYGIVHDITEFKKLQFELQEQQRLEQQKLTAAALQAQEKERNAIGIELHDNVNQLLAGSKMILTMACSKPEEATEFMQVAIEGLEEAIQENRKIAHELVSPDFEQKKLIEQLSNLTQNMLINAGIKVTLDTSNLDEHLLDHNQKLTLFRVAQEQCTNIIKYAKANAVQLKIWIEQHAIRMVICDDGIGMPEGKQTDGIGLRNIRSRLSVYNGAVSITTAPGKGFMLEAVMPLVEDGGGN